MEKPEFVLTKRMIIATTMVLVVAAVMVVSFLWGPASV
jgi:preprotein translocase subunit SecE